MGALEGKGRDGYGEEGPCLGTGVCMTFPGVCLLHGAEGNCWQGRVVYIHSGMIVLIDKEREYKAKIRQ